MARHRNVRTMKYEDEFFDEDDVEDCYGQSFDDKYCISPGTAAQFTFSRGSNFDLGSYISGEAPEAIPSQMPEIITPKSQAAKVTQKVQKYSDLDEARLNSCLDQVRDVIADLHPKEVLVDCIRKHNFNCEAVLNELLSSPDAPKPQRQPRQGRRAQEFPLDLYAQSDTVSSEYDDVDDDDDYDHERDISKCSLIMAVPHYKLCQEYNSVGEEECSSYSSLNSGDTEESGSFLSEQNRNSPSHNKIQMCHLKSGSTSSENVAPSTESSDDDDDLEIDGVLQSIDDIDDNNDVIVEQMMCFPHNTESSNMVCKPKESFELPNVTPNNRKGLLMNNTCNDKKLNSVKAIPILSASKVQAPKSDKQELLKLFTMANMNKQKMEESANLASTNNENLSASPKPSLCEEISRSPLQNKTCFEGNLQSAEKNSCRSSLADIFQQRHNSPNGNNNRTEKCEECSANQGNSKKNFNRMSLADLAKQRFGSNSQQLVSAVGGSLSQKISSSCPSKPNNLPSSVQSSSTNSSCKPLIDLTNHRFGKGLNFSNKNGKTSILDNSKSLNSANESSEVVSVEKMIPTKKPTLSLGDLMKQRSTPFQRHKNFSITDPCELKLENTSQIIGKQTLDVEPGIDVDIKESEHSSSKTHSDYQKKGSPELSNREDSDCQPMSLGELFSQVSNSKVDLEFESTSKLEDLWQGPSSKPKTEQQPDESNKIDMETTEKKFLLPSFLNEASSEYENLKIASEASASLFGRVVSYHPKTIECAEKVPRKNKYKKFSYKTQMCGVNSKQEIKLAQIVPFDFSTLSPDDIVKKQQSKAFGHKKNT